MLTLKPGDTYYGEFAVCNPSTGAAIAADELPVATARRNGVDDINFVLTVASISAGRYSATGNVPVTYSAGDIVTISIAATVNTISGLNVIDSIQVVTVAPSDLVAPIAAIPTTPLLAENYTAPPTVVAIRAELDSNSAKLARLDTTISSRATVNNIWAAETRTITDKTGFSLSTASILAIWNQATAAAGILVNTFGAKLRDLALGSDSKVLISANAQDLSESLSVNAKTVTDKTGYALTSAYDAAKTAATQASVTAIPVNPLLTTDARLDRIASIPTDPLQVGDYTAPDNASITAILTALQNATYGLARLDTEIDTITTALAGLALNADMQTLLARLSGARALLIDNLQYITEIPGLTAGQVEILTEARDEAKLARQLAGNKAVIAPDGLTVTIYADDDTTPLWTFSTPDAKTRIPA